MALSPKERQIKVPVTLTLRQNGEVTTELLPSVNYSRISHERAESPTMESATKALKVSSQFQGDTSPTSCTVAVKDEWLTLNVGGSTFLTRQSTLMAVPDTLLADLDQTCVHYHPPTGQYLFDRNPYIFQYILDFYRTGELHFPHNLCGPTVKKELNFWGIDENLIQPCCWNNYRDFAEQEETLKTLGTAFNVIDSFDNDGKAANVLLKQVHIWRARIWYFLEDPTSSALAQFWATFYVLLIMTSVLTLAFDSHADFRVPSPVNRTQNPNETNPKKVLLNTTNPHPAMYITEFFISSIFAVDLLLRLIVCPSKVRFLKSYLNWLDIVVVVSQWTTSIIAFQPNFWENPDLQFAYQIFSQMRICRIFLIFKLARHYTGLRILLLALKASFKEMILLTMIMVIGMVIFATLIYYAEFEQPTQFANIPTGFWWSIVTMTTVGYGDVHPKSAPGYFVGALCALCGMLATGLPIPIIANNFTLYYDVSKLKERLDTRDASVKVSTELLGGVKGIFSGVKNVAACAGSKVISMGNKAKLVITPEKEDKTCAEELKQEEEEGEENERNEKDLMTDQNNIAKTV